MKIGIDCRLLGAEQGGLGRYVEQLVWHLSSLDQTNDYVLFLRPQNLHALKIASPHFKYTTVEANIPWYGWAEQWQFPRLIKKQHVDLMHFPHWNVPLLYLKPFVLTVHDLIMYHYPRAEATTLGPIKFWLKDRLSRLVIGRAIARARTILTTSQFTATDIAAHFPVAKNKMVVTYQASFLTATTAQIPVDLAKWGITKPYVLYVGAAYPHKNLENVLAAWPDLQAKTNQEFQLVLVGKNNYFYNRLRTQAAADELTDVVFTDFVQDSELNALYREARLFVYPSLYEGFGLPPLEAWEVGVPVAASNRSCLPEVLGSGALYFDPESVENMVQTLVTGLTNLDIRAELKANVVLEKPRFSWSKLASQTLAVYTKAHTQ